MFTLTHYNIINKRYGIAFSQNPYKFYSYLDQPSTKVKNQFYASDVYIFDYLGQIFIISTFFFHKVKPLSVQ